MTSISPNLAITGTAKDETNTTNIWLIQRNVNISTPPPPQKKANQYAYHIKKPQNPSRTCIAADITVPYKTHLPCSAVGVPTEAGLPPGGTGRNRPPVSWRWRERRPRAARSPSPGPPTAGIALLLSKTSPRTRGRGPVNKRTVVEASRHKSACIVCVFLVRFPLFQSFMYYVWLISCVPPRSSIVGHDKLVQSPVARSCYV